MCPWFDSWRHHLKHKNPLQGVGFFIPQSEKSLLLKAAGYKKTDTCAASGFCIFSRGAKGTAQLSPGRERNEGNSW
ncbi:MAG: hypothetical protein KIH80_007170 [Flavobacteriia bacterium]|nr:hypothetical protein [Flavobacteriia bacterium]